MPKCIIFINNFINILFQLYSKSVYDSLEIIFIIHKIKVPYEHSVIKLYTNTIIFVSCG